jgi:hypothetical protein
MWGMILPFLTNDPEFAHGVEVGMLHERMKVETHIKGTFLTVNQEQITLMANRYGWTIDRMDIQKPPYNGDFYLEMHKTH